LSFAQAGPTVQVRGTIDGVLDILRDPALKGPEKEGVRAKQLKKIIFSRFDFPEMARRSLGMHWRKRTAQEREEFVSIFSDLLERSYRKKIERYTDQKIIYSAERVDGKYGVVTTAISDKRENLEIPIDYRVIRRNDQWKVYDVVIDGISLVSNYRSQFNRILSKRCGSSRRRKWRRRAPPPHENSKRSSREDQYRLWLGGGPV
jgi:phospholipid transport system substrate-binding protein